MLIRINEKEPISTETYPHAKFPFDNFNPVQSALIDIYDKDANCIVAASTSAGKTVCAEMFMAHEVRVRGNKTIYLSPLKALSQEKLDDWLGGHHFSNLKVAICTGDYRITQNRIKELNAADVIIMTSEMLNSLSRNFKSEKNQWLQEVGLLVIDECLPPNALIETDKGLIPIGDIIDKNLDIKVASFNHQTQKIEYKKIVNRVKKYKKKKWLSIYYDGGDISVTLDHLVYCDKKGYIPSKLLKVGDIIYVRRINKQGKTNCAGNLIGGWFAGNSSTQEICSLTHQSIGEAKGFDRVEIRTIKEIGWNSAKNSKQRRLWQQKLSLYNTILEATVRYLSLNISKWQEKNNRRLAQRSQRPSSIGCLVYGRWKPKQKYDDNTHRGFFKRRSRLLNQLVKSILENRLPTIPIQKLLENYILCSRKRLLSKHNKRGNHTGISLQNDTQVGENLLLNVWKNIRSKSPIFFRKQNFIMWFQRMLREMEIYLEQNMDVEKTSVCCDLEIEDNHNFFANGVLVHNCHLIGTSGRGDHLESGIIKFTEGNPQSRILMLSATMPNVDEVGNWLSSLNNKSTYLIESNYRPCKLNIHYDMYVDKKMNYDENERIKIYQTCQIVKKHSQDKFICFVHSKKTGDKLVQFLDACGIECDYHNANLDKEDRIKIEQRFREDPKLRVVVATSGLAQGLNMPARRVIVVGVHRGLNDVETHEIIQECGRAGRPKYDTEGDAYILIPKSKFNYHKDRLEEKVYIRSQMINPKVLAFHLVSEIHHGEIRSLEDVYHWYGRTLAHFQKHKLHEDIIDQVIESLLYSGCITDEYKTTSLGTVASMFYYSPFDVADLNRNFNALFKNNTADRDTWLAMALGNVDSHRTTIVNTSEREEMGEFFAEIQGSKIEKALSPKASFSPGTMKAAYCYKQLLSGEVSKNLNNTMRVLQMDFGRTTEVLAALDNMTGKWGQSQFFRDLSLRMTYGVGAELVDLCQLSGIGAVKSKKLYSAGLRKLKDIKEVPKVIKALGCSKNVAEELVAEAKAILLKNAVSLEALP